MSWLKLRPSVEPTVLDLLGECEREVWLWLTPWQMAREATTRPIYKRFNSVGIPLTDGLIRDFEVINVAAVVLSTEDFIFWVAKQGDKTQAQRHWEMVKKDQKGGVMAHWGKAPVVINPAMKAGPVYVLDQRARVYEVTHR